MKEKILQLLEKEELTAQEIAKRLGISRQMAHRHLKALIKENKIGKKGIPPKVSYFALPTETRIKESFDAFKLFWDKFKDKKILKVFNTPFSTNKWDLHFLIETSAFYSSKIEGNKLDLNSFLNKAEIPKRSKDFKEIEDLKLAYKFASEHAFTEKNLLKSHDIFTKSFLSKSLRGRYRKSPVAVYSDSGLEYMAPEPEYLQKEMSLLFSVIQELLNEKNSKKEAVFWSVYIHIMLALIHPFADGNGRIARLAQKWFLSQKLGKKYWYIELERFYFENRIKYYKALQLGLNYWYADFKKAKKFIDMHFKN